MNRDEIHNLMNREFGLGFNDPDPAECTLGLLNMTTNLMTFPFWQMLDSTAPDLFQQGDALICDKIGSETANYMVMEIWINVVPTRFKMGFCWPA